MGLSCEVATRSGHAIARDSVSPFTPHFSQESLAGCALVMAEATRCFNRRRYRILVSLAAVLLVSAVVIHPHDRAILESIHAPASPFLDRLAGELGEWGDFLTFNLLGLLRLDPIKRARRLAQRAEVVRLDGERSLLRSKWVEAAEDS